MKKMNPPTLLIQHDIKNGIQQLIVIKNGKDVVFAVDSDGVITRTKNGKKTEIKSIKDLAKAFAAATAAASMASVNVHAEMLKASQGLKK